ncbi:MAG: beta-glucosidase BglX [Bacteroidales bacterium]
MRTFLSFPLALLFLVIDIASCDTKPAPENQDEIIAARVDSLMELMTLEEKIGQLNMPGAGDITTGLASNTGIVPKIREGKVGALLNIRGVEKIHETQRIAVEESRLGIPLIFAMDVIHGYKTLFPVPLALASSWDMEMIEKTAKVAANEASLEGISLTFSPMIDISREPRWGRVVEGAGEDPYLGSRVAKAMVRGYQGDDLSHENTLMSCFKHLANYGAVEAGREYNTVDMSKLRMFNDYFPPYKAAVEAGAGSAMSSFNDVIDIPATANKWLLTDVLREQWGFNGFVLSDYTCVLELPDHGVAEDLQSASAMALEAGLDMDMVSEGFLTTLAASVEEGSLSEEAINQACRRVLSAKFKLGLFDNPYQYGNKERAVKEVFSQENRNFARKTAAETFVLLKNENNMLPLDKKGTIAVIGPLGNNRENMAGTWSVAGDFEKCVSLVDGLKNAAGDKAEILFSKGSNIVADPELEARVSIFGKPTYRSEKPAHELISEALSVARKSDVIIAAIGEAAEMSGECSSRTDINIPDVQMDLLKALVKTGKPVVMVLFTGRPLSITWADENVPVILNAWFGGTETGNALADVIFGDVNPSGKLTLTFPRNLGQVPIYNSMKSTGRPLKGEWFEKFRSNYLDVPNTPLYPFGYGLSYSSFEYGEIKFSKAEAVGEDTIVASIEVTNTSDRDGKEIIQLYIHDPVASVTRPDKELKGFKKILIPAGETREISFELTTEVLKFYKYDPESGYTDIVHEWEPGDFEVMIGGRSDEVRMGVVRWGED